MSSLTRTIRRKMIFASMNKQQRLIWRTTHGGKNNQRLHDQLKNTMPQAEKE